MLSETYLIEKYCRFNLTFFTVRYVHSKSSAGKSHSDVGKELDEPVRLKKKKSLVATWECSSHQNMKTFVFSYYEWDVFFPLSWWTVEAPSNSSRLFPCSFDDYDITEVSRLEKILSWNKLFLLVLSIKETSVLRWDICYWSVIPGVCISKPCKLQICQIYLFCFFIQRVEN